MLVVRYFSITTSKFFITSHFLSRCVNLWLFYERNKQIYQTIYFSKILYTFYNDLLLLLLFYFSLSLFSILSFTLSLSMPILIHTTFLFHLKSRESPSKNWNFFIHLKSKLISLIGIITYTNLATLIENVFMIVKSSSNDLRYCY